MSPKERARLMQALACLDMPRPANAGSPRRRRLFLIVTIVCCVGLAAWIGVLAVTLPRFYRAGDWRGAWVGFDLAELAAFAATAWAAWRGRQVLIMCLLVLATLLLCDAWFDVTLDLRTSDFLVSVLMALCVELPLAALAVVGARRLMRLNIRTVGRLAGRSGRVPPLWKIPLYGMDSRGFRTLIPAAPCPPAESLGPDDLVPAEEPSRSAPVREEPGRAAPGRAVRG